MRYFPLLIAACFLLTSAPTTRAEYIPTPVWYPNGIVSNLTDFEGTKYDYFQQSFQTNATTGLIPGSISFTIPTAGGADGTINGEMIEIGIFNNSSADFSQAILSLRVNITQSCSAASAKTGNYTVNWSSGNFSQTVLSDSCGALGEWARGTPVWRIYDTIHTTPPFNATLTPDTTYYLAAMWKEANIFCGGPCKKVSYFNTTNTTPSGRYCERSGANTPAEAISGLACIYAGQADVLGHLYMEGAIPFPPSTPTLTGTVTGYDSVLTWTPATGSVLGYNLTRTEAWGATSIIRLGLVTTYTDHARSTNRTYTVHAWGPGGNSSESNSVTLRQTPRELFGEDGLIYGQGRTELANAARINTSALDLGLAIFFILLLASLGYVFFPNHRAPASIVGALLGALLDLSAGILQVWVLVFGLAILAAAFLLTRGRQTG